MIQKFRLASTALAAVALAIIATLSGCASAPTEPSVTATDVWIRAIPDLAEQNMTGIFGNFTNNTGTEITILGGTIDASIADEKLDAHEVVMDDAGEMVMQDAAGGIPIPANGQVELKMGGYHVMLWNLKAPLEVGQKVKITLNFSDGTSLPIEAVVRSTETEGEHYHESEGEHHHGTPTPATSMSN
jgi:copper(I)-binding protein